MKYKVVGFTLIFIFFFTTAVCWSGSWQETLESNFDIVSTFDELQNWRGINNLHGYDHNKDNQPKKLDGSPSIWDMYDDWSYLDPDRDWIGEHGSDFVWRGTGKSLRMDLNPDDHAMRKGPSRFGLYYGSNTLNQADGYATNGLVASGYNELYLFYMVKLPHNMFPTEDGEDWPSDYKNWSYHKFATISTGFTDINHINGAANPEGTGCRWEYGCGFYLMGLNTCGSKCSGDYLSNTLTHLGLDYVADVHGSYYTPLYRLDNLKSGWAGDFMNLQARDGKWFGLEFHLNRGSAGAYDGSVEIWVYSEEGSEKLIYKNESLIFRQAGTDFAFNKFFFGGNLSYSDEVEQQQLDTTYYVDDFIINDTRIGPTYFKLLAGLPVKTIKVRDVDPTPGRWEQ